MGQVSPKPPHFCLVACYPPAKSRSHGPRGGRRCGGSSLSPPPPGLSTSQQGAGRGGTSSASHHSGPPDSREIRQRRRGKECAPLPRGNTSPCRQIAPWRRGAAEPPGPQNASNPALPSPTSPPAAGIHSTMPRRGARSIPLPTARPGGHSSSARPPGKPQIVIAFLAFLPQHQQLGGSSGQQSSRPPPGKRLGDGGIISHPALLPGTSLPGNTEQGDLCGGERRAGAHELTRCGCSAQKAKPRRGGRAM